MVYYSRLEIQDENDQAMVVSSRSEYLGTKANLARFNKSNLQYAVRNLGTIKPRIKFGNEVRCYLDCVDQTGLVGYWPLDGDAKDESAPKGKYNGIVNGASWVVLDGEYALDFAKSISQYVAVPAAVINGLTDFSFETKVKMRPTPTGKLSAIISSVKSDGVNEFSLYHNGTTQLMRVVIKGSDQGYFNGDIDDDAEHTVGYVRSGTTGKLFIDGVLADTKTVSSSAFTIAGNYIYFGQELDLPDGGFDATQALDGSLKKPKFWSRALSDTEMLDSHNGEVITSGLISYWRFDEGTGTIAYDSMTIKHDGTINGATPFTSSRGKMLDFDGANNYVTIPNHSSLNGFTELTVMLRLIPDTVPAGTAVGTVMRKQSDAGDLGLYGAWLEGAGRANAQKWRAFVHNGTTELAVFSSGQTTLGNEITLGFTFKAGTIKLYINGVLDNSNTIAGVITLATSAKSLEIGRYRNTDSLHSFDGKEGEPIIFARELSAQEMLDWHNSLIHNKRIFTGVQLDYDDEGTFNEVLTITCRDFFDDLRQSETITKKYVDQEVATTVIDVINGVNTRRDAGLTTTEVETLDISHPYNFVVESLDHSLSRVTSDSFSELFMRPNKSVVLRELSLVDSKLTIIDSNIRDPDKVSNRQGISDSYGIIRVCGGLSTEAYDTNKRVIAEHRVPAADATIAKRAYPVVDERFTTWSGAKMHAMTLAADIGSQYFAFDQPLSVHDIVILPMPGELVRLNSSEMSVDRKFVCDEVSLTQEIGTDSITHIDLKLGQTEYSETRTLRLLRDQFEQDKRKDLDQDADTNQRSFCVSVKLSNGITLTITTRNPASSPYVWADGDGNITGNEGKWGYFTWGGR